MKPEINKLDYSSFRTPLIEEFTPGFEYEEMSFSITKPTKIPLIGLCKAQVGNTILKARILNMDNQKGTVHIKFLEKGYTPNYMKIMGYDYNPITNEDKAFPTTLLYNYEEFEKPYVFYKETQQFWQKHNYIKGTGGKDNIFLKKRLKKGIIIAKGQILLHQKAQHPWENDWLSINLPNNKIHTKKLNTATTIWKLPYRFGFKWDYPLSLEYYHNNYPGNLHRKFFKTEESLISFIIKNQNIIKKINKATKLTGYAKHIPLEISETQIKKHIQNQKIKQAMSIKQLREKLITGHILCFMFKGLNIEIKPQISSTKSSYNFSKSIFINNKPINSLDINSEELKIWNITDKNCQFKQEIYKLISPYIHASFSKDEDRVLSKYIYNIRTPKIGETRFYIASCDNKKIEIIREFNKERAKIAVMHITNTHEDTLWEVKEHGT